MADRSIDIGWLRHYLDVIPPGPIFDTTQLERLVAASWQELVGDDGGMKCHKLLVRMEDLAWSAAPLTFTIKPHGPGSDRGDTPGVGHEPGEEDSPPWTAGNLEGEGSGSRLCLWAPSLPRRPAPANDALDTGCR